MTDDLAALADRLDFMLRGARASSLSPYERQSIGEAAVALRAAQPVLDAARAQAVARQNWLDIGIFHGDDADAAHVDYQEACFATCDAVDGSREPVQAPTPGEELHDPVCPRCGTFDWKRPSGSHHLLCWRCGVPMVDSAAAAPTPTPPADTETP